METLTRWQDPTIDDLKKEINKLTAESTEWEERTYYWQDKAEKYQIVLDKIKDILLYKYPVLNSDMGDLKQEILKLLEEIE